MECDAASYRSDRYPERQRAERARDRAGADWCRANEARLCAAVWSLATINDEWPQLARTTTSKQVDDWRRELDGPALAARLQSLRLILDSYGADLPVGTTAAAARDEVLALLGELRAARHSADLPDGGRRG